MRKTRAENLLVLALFGVFAACVLSVLLTGAGVYRRLTERDDAACDRRTALQYVAAKMRQADREGAVAAGRFAELDALILTEEIGEEAYETWVYCYDGYLRELFAERGADLAPEDGEKVLAADGFQVCLEREDLLRLDILTGGRWETAALSLRSGKGYGA